MLSKGPAKRVTIHINEDTQHHFGALHDAIMTFLLHKGVSGATCSRAMAGFGANRLMHTPKIEVLAQHLPVVIEFVETAQKVDELLPTLYDMVSDGLIDVQDTTVIKDVNKDKDKKAPLQAHVREAGPAQLMRVFLGEADRWHEEPLYDAIVKRLRMMEISGATVYRGILGYGAKGHTHKQSFLHLSRDMPVMISVIDTPAKIAQASAAIEEMLQDGLIVFSDVEMVRLVHKHSLEEASHAEDSPR